MTTPLTKLADQNAARAAAAVTTLTGQLADLDTALAAAGVTAAAATANLATLRQLEVDLRAKLGRVPLPADADQLTDQLEQTLVDQQAATADAAGAADELGSVQRDRARTAAALAIARTTLASTADAAAATRADAERVEAWRTVVTASPFADAVTTAKSARTKAPYTDARDRLFDVLDKPLPANKGPDATHPLGQGLLDQLAARAAEADARRAEQTDALTRIRDAAWTLAGTSTPLDVAVARATATRAALVDRLRALATGAVADLTSALATCTAIAAGPIPTTAEQGRMDGYHAAALTAAGKERAVFAAAATLREKRAAFDTAVLGKIQTDPDFAAATSDAVKTERQAVADAEGKLAAAEADLAAVRAELDLWEVALPEPIKAQVVAFVDADGTLRDLGDVTVAQLTTALQAADQALADALQARDVQRAGDARLRDELARRSAADAAATAGAADRRAALIRGEG